MRKRYMINDKVKRKLIEWNEILRSGESIRQEGRERERGRVISAQPSVEAAPGGSYSLQQVSLSETE